MGFVQELSELNLYPMEERPVAMKIPFIQFQNLPCSGQKLVSGNLINVPDEIAPTANILSKSMKNTDTVAIKFKRRKIYKLREFSENK